jgi:hypothetical protein
MPENNDPIFLAAEIFVWLAKFRFLYSGSNSNRFSFVFRGVLGSNHDWGTDYTDCASSWLS